MLYRSGMLVSGSVYIYNNVTIYIYIHIMYTCIYTYIGVSCMVYGVRRMVYGVRLGGGSKPEKGRDVDDFQRQLHVGVWIRIYIYI